MSKKILICSVLLAAFAIDCPAQTLADVARRERERQKQSRPGTGGSVVGSGATVTTSASSSSTASTAAPAKPATAPGDKPVRDEKYWRAQFQKARDDAKRADERVQVLELKLKDLNTQLLRQSDVYNREYRIGAEITETQKQLDDGRKAGELSKKKITDLEEELRRSGGPPGWAR